MNRSVAATVLFAIVLITAPAVSAQTTASHPGDVNCDSVLTSADIIYLVNYVFKSGPWPCGDSSQVVALHGLSDIDQLYTRSNTPGQIDTLRVDNIYRCSDTSSISARVYLHNHDSLYTLIMPIRIERLSGEGFIRFDSLVWIDRMRDSTIVDYARWSPIEVDGASMDWVHIGLGDYLFEGKPPLDSGAGYLCELFFTPIGGPGEVLLRQSNWGVFPDVGFVEFIYEAKEFALSIYYGSYTYNPGLGSGELNCDAAVNTIDIIRLVNIIFKGAEP